MNALSWLTSVLRTPSRHVRPTLRRSWEILMEGDFEANARRRYKEHYSMVLELAPQGHLLEYQINEGWGPLCHFLGKDKPDLPFPQVNSSDVIMNRFQKLSGTAIASVATRICIGTCATAALHFAIRFFAH